MLTVKYIIRLLLVCGFATLSCNVSIQTAGGRVLTSFLGQVFTRWWQIKTCRVVAAF